MFISDPTAAGLGATVHVQSIGSGFDETLTTGADGHLALHTLPFGVYTINARSSGFAPANLAITIDSVFPVERTIQLAAAPLFTVVNVNGVGTLINPEHVSGTTEIGRQEIQQRLTSLPGRSVRGSRDYTTRVAL